MPVPVTAVVLLLVSTLGLAACSGGGGDDASSSSTTSSTTAAPVSTRAGASDCNGFRGSTTSLTSSGPNAPGFLVDATAGAQGCLDVVTLTFQTRGDGTPPGYVVRYRDVTKEPFTEAAPPTDASQSTDGQSTDGQSTDGSQSSDGSSDGSTSETEPPTDTQPPTVIDVPGAAHLQVSVTPAASVDSTDPANPQQTYTGNLSLGYGAHNHLVVVRELPDTKDAAGQDTVNWVIGLDSVRPFRVDRAENPTRITILIG